MSAEFFNVQPVRQALELLFEHWGPSPRPEKVDTRRALGRVLAAALRSPTDLPAFDRSAMDGYAVRAADTFGASQSLPAYLSVAGKILMGQAASSAVEPHQAIEIYTGGMLPLGADAVVMIERTQQIGNGEIEVLAPVAPGENVVRTGEDVAQGEAILPVGHRLRPQDIGGLLAAGLLAVEAAAAPRVGILSSGDELVPPEETPALGQVRDINAYTLAALVEQLGGEAIPLGIARDTFEDYLGHARVALAKVDLLIMTAGSSVSSRDLTVTVINALGKPGVLQHGLAVKPGKPAILAVCDGKPVIGLPGNPVSALLVARQIVAPLIRRMLGENIRPLPSARAVLSANIPSASGREDSVPVRLLAGEDGFVAEPIFGKSNLIFTLMNADGLVTVPLNSSGIRAGSEVEVTLFEDDRF